MKRIHNPHLTRSVLSMLLVSGPLGSGCGNGGSSGNRNGTSSGGASSDEVTGGVLSTGSAAGDASGPSGSSGGDSSDSDDGSDSGAPRGIVYSRCVRAAGTLEIVADVTFGGEVQSVSRTMTGLDAYDIMPDVSNFFTGFSAPCDLVLRAFDGNETVLYDCSTTSTDEEACAALDASVSFDGNSVVFSVFRGSLERATISSLNARVLDPDADDATVLRVTSPSGSRESSTVYLPNKRLSPSVA